MERAEKLAKEIEGTASGNIHVQEERGQVAEHDADWDEEDRYSGVGIIGTVPIDHKEIDSGHQQQMEPPDNSHSDEVSKEDYRDQDESHEGGVHGEEEVEDVEDTSKPSKLSSNLKRPSIVEASSNACVNKEPKRRSSSLIRHLNS